MIANPTRSWDPAESICWQCGAPARAECAYRLLLVADPSREVAALGYPVERGTRRDKLRIPVPRCARCQDRNRLSIVLVLGGTALGAIVVPILQALYWPNARLPAWVHSSHEGIGNSATGIGIVAGFVIALLAVFLHRQWLGLQPINSYPPVIRLREEGWRYPD